MKPFINTLLFAAVVMTFATSCIVDNEPVSDTPFNKAGKVDIKLTLRTPGGFATPKARSLSYADENAIADVWVLVFDDDVPSKLAGVYKADDVDDKTGTVTSPAGGYSGGGGFSITLPGSMKGEDANLVVLANAEDILDDCGLIDKTSPETASPKIGENYSDVIGAISEEIDGAMYPGATGETIPMWGETGLITVDPSDEPGITLMRAVARIDVGVGDQPNYDAAADPAYSWDGKDASNTAIKFQLTSVHVVKANKEYLVVPATANRSGNSVTQPTTPTNVPKFGANNDAEARALSYTVSNNLYTTQSIYVPEADIVMTGPSNLNHTNRMALVVGGKYDGSSETSYYRLDFANGGTLMNVLRNHLYRFNISAVAGKGYSSVLEAYTADAMNNITADVVDMDESEMEYMMVDGSFYLGVSEREVVLDGSGETTTVEIKTNIPYFTMNVGGGDAELKADDNTKKTYTADGITYTLSGPVGDVYTLTVSAPQNPSTTDSPTHDWSISARRFNMTLRSLQRPTRVPGVRAIKGVIGYYVNGNKEGQLTLDGDDGDNEDVVVVAYFKFGSLIALDSSDERDGFTADEIIAAPTVEHGYRGLESLKEYIAGFGTTKDAWDAVPHITTAHGLVKGDKIYKVADTSKALGDACTYYFGNQWRLPTAVELVRFVGGPNSGSAEAVRWKTWVAGDETITYTDGTANSGMEWDYWNHGGAVHAGTPDDPHTGSFPVVANAEYAAFSQMLPAAGRRNPNGDITNQSVQGIYWTSEAYSTVSGHRLFFTAAGLESGDRTEYNNGFAVRCMKV